MTCSRHPGRVAVGACIPHLTPPRGPSASHHLPCCAGSTPASTPFVLPTLWVPRDRPSIAALHAHTKADVMGPRRQRFHGNTASELTGSGMHTSLHRRVLERTSIGPRWSAACAAPPQAAPAGVIFNGTFQRQFSDFSHLPPHTERARDQSIGAARASSLSLFTRARICWSRPALLCSSAFFLSSPPSPRRFVPCFVVDQRKEGRRQEYLWVYE